MINSILVWNCRGAISASFYVILKDLMNLYRHAILVLVETWIQSERAWPWLENLNIKGMATSEPIGFSGGIWVI